MRGASTSTLIIVTVVIATVALAGLAVLRMGEAAGGGVSASVSLAEEGGVVTATIHVLKGALTGVAIKYAMPNGSAWWARPIYCIAVNNTAEVTPIAAYFSRPVPAGQAVTCAFYIWAQENGMYSLWVLGYGPGARSATFAQSRLQLSANKYGDNIPAMYEAAVEYKPTAYTYILVPMNWNGSTLTVKVNWGYTQASHYKNNSPCIGQGLYVSLFVPINYTAVVTPSADYETVFLGRDLDMDVFWLGGPDFTPAGSSKQLFAQFNPYAWGLLYGILEFAVMNATAGSGTYGNQGLNPDKNWPANVWTSYLIYDAKTNTLTVEWIVSGVFDVTRTFNAGSYGFTPPSPGQYYVAMGLANYGCYADWKIYSYTIAVS